MEKIKYIICITVLMCVLGCQSETRRDPYVAAIEAYKADLAGFDYEAGEKPPSPPKPVFLSGRQSMGRLQIPLGYSTRPIGPVLSSTSSDFYGNTALFDQSVVSIAEIERINKERREAYNGALAEYESAIYRFKSQKTQPHN